MKQRIIKHTISIAVLLLAAAGCSKTNALEPDSKTSENPKMENFEVSLKEALDLATNGNTDQNSNVRTDATGRKIVKKVEPFIDARGKTVFYVINFDENKGFLLLSADRRLTPILAYSDENAFDLKTDNPGLLLWEDLVVEHLRGVEKNQKAHIDVINQWRQFEDTNHINGRTTDAPVLTPEASCQYFVTHPIPANVTIQHMTDQFTNWSQGPGYNYYCPANSFPGCGGNCNIAVTGCGPVAVGQVLRYHKKAITTNGRTFTAAMFNAMPKSLSSNNCALSVESQQNVAHLLRDTGVDLNVIYNTPNILLGGLVSGTGCQSWNIPGHTDNFFSNHGYTSFDINFFDPGSENTVRTELLAHRPVVVFGSSCSSCLKNAHIWVMDGVQDLHNIYQDQNGYCYENRVTLYQMNWGWLNVSENSGWFNYTSISGSGTLYNSSNMIAYIVRP
jgi:hypothetical protein